MLVSRHRSSARALLAAALLSPTALAAQATAAPAAGAGPVAATVPQSAPITEPRYELVFDRGTASRRVVRVAFTFGTAGTAPVILSLPSWTPGAYEITPFARWVTNFAATAPGTSGQGSRSLAWDKVDHDSWRVLPAGAGQVTVSFDYVADSLDNAMAWTRPDFLLVNGTTVFMYPEGRPLDVAAQVRVRTERDWRVVTGMAPAGPPLTYRAATYHDLVDMPFFVGRFDVDSQQVAGKWMRLATYPSGSVTAAVRAAAWESLRKMTPPQVAVFGETPWDTYTVMQIADTSYQGASGLEHQNSHVDIITPLAIGNPFLYSLYSHEIFHAWNVKRMRPAEMWPYRYDAPQPTEWLWVSEGITDYYADLALVRGGVIDAQGFYETTAGKMSEVLQAPPVSLEDASLSTWVHPVDGTAYIYYPKGSLAGLLYDILIRDASDNKASLDDVMREVYQRSWQQGRGFTAEDWWGAVARAAGGRNLDSIYTRYVDGREPFPWDRVLPLAGLRAAVQQAPRLGVSSEQDSAGVRVTAVDPGGAAEQAGVRVGDYVLAVGDVTVGDVNFGQQFRMRYGSAPAGSALPIRVRRGAQTLTLVSRLQLVPIGMRVTEDPNASAKAVRIRTGILRGTKG
ncbi:MAG TPA: PDZ domain-containing protein [Gemmatimonadaceae bacterium]|nr:PDZ domain-containing protein [Gemmatimonadaceae bacterium]